ncbi:MULTISPECIES: hypothetical protein [Bacillales]|uniref:hypothetical protein n=1 Tax=Bacillales TaxID=1385 RepID=UPI0003491CD4|nr:MULTISPECIES: hypothetical protein [Bacillales]KMZ42523.1 hypothetical protein AC624_16105 [Bacillus sp. FJAT-27238]
MKSDELKYTCESHIRDLEKKLNEIYTVDAPTEFKDGKVEKVNILDELSRNKTLESIYSVVEAAGVHEGEVFSKYFGYLENVRKSNKIISELQEKVEREHAADIKNIRLLIDVFKIKLNESKRSL